MSIPDDYQYTDKLGVKWKSYCDSASKMAVSGVALLGSVAMFSMYWDR